MKALVRNLKAHDSKTGKHHTHVCTYNSTIIQIFANQTNFSMK